MLTSLFGDLEDPARRRAAGTPDGAEPGPATRPGADAPGSGFAATTIAQTVQSAPGTDGRMVDRHLTELVVSGSPAAAIREHLSTSRADLDAAARMITLVDPTGVWAGAVVKTLSDATGRPVERLNLREPGTLRLLATVERTVLMRRQVEPLKVWHAEARAPGRAHADIALALAERSHLTAVVVGPLPPHGVDELLQGLDEAAHAPGWHCPELLFLLPPDAAWVVQKVRAVSWPAGTRVVCVDEPLVSATAVWNAVLGVWNKVKHASSPGAGAMLPGFGDFPIKVADLPGSGTDTRYGTTDLGRFEDAPGHHAPAGGAPPTIRPAPALDRLRAQQQLIELAAHEGVLAVALVDSRAGTLVASEHRGETSMDLGAAAVAAAHAARAQRQMTRALGLPDRIEESVVLASHHQIVTRRLAHHGDLALVAVLRRTGGVLAQMRFRLSEAERALA